MRKKIRIIIFSIITLLSLFVLFTTIQKGRYFFPDKEYRHQTFNKRIPDNQIFANEVVHFKNQTAYMSFYKELRLNTQQNKSTTLVLKDASIWLPVIEKILIQHNIPTDFKYVAMVESNFRNLVSNKNAVGFWQLKEETARELGLEINDEVDERYDPIRSTYAACRFFKQAYRQFGSWTVTAASYNRGMGGIERAFKKQKASDYYDLNLNKETSKYIYKLLAVKDMVEHPKRYGLRMYRWERERVRMLKVTQDIEDLNDYAIKNNTSLYVLKLYNPWLLSNTLTIKERGGSYTIELPYPRPKVRKDSLITAKENI